MNTKLDIYVLILVQLGRLLQEDKSERVKQLQPWLFCNHGDLSMVAIKC